MGMIEAVLVNCTACPPVAGPRQRVRFEWVKPLAKQIRFPSWGKWRRLGIAESPYGILGALSTLFA
jgi:hypothetical protein